MISETAVITRHAVYLVGGCVRDLLLKKKNLDIDIATEPHCLELVKKLAGGDEKRYKYHEQFGTATIELEDGLKIDFASARKEFYKKPAALPIVRPAAIWDDLHRRDFSINAMAVSLNAGSFGKLLDFFGGRYDLKHKNIRVLHALSFIDDPTRIFRAVRFEQRLGFKIEPATLEFLKYAIDIGMIGRLTDYRLKNELELIKAEPKAAAMMKRLTQLLGGKKVKWDRG